MLKKSNDASGLYSYKAKIYCGEFVRLTESLKTSSCGERLKDIVLENGIIVIAVKHIKEIFAVTGQAGFKSSTEWLSSLKLPSVPLILSMLRGLSMGHLRTQTCIDEGGIVPLLHALEVFSGENEIGARAENLLDTLADKEGKGDGFLGEKVRALRDATKDEMRRRALRKRQELLQGLGMHQEVCSDGGERIVVCQPVLEGFEDGLACMVCREGYKLRPTGSLFLQQTGESRCWHFRKRTWGMRLHYRELLQHHSFPMSPKKRKEPTLLLRSRRKNGKELCYVTMNLFATLSSPSKVP